MKFEVIIPCIIFHDDRPGNEAKMFGPDGERLPFRPDLSSFSDEKKEYSWAFERIIRPGDMIRFSTLDRQVHGLMTENNRIKIVDRPNAILNKEASVPVEKIINGPPTKQKLRPILLRRK